MELLGYPVMIFAALCFFCFLYHLNKKTSLPVHWPLFGTLPSLLINIYNGRLYDWLTEVLSKSGGTYVFKGPWFANMEVLFTSDPANIRHILNTNFSNYPKGPEYNEIFDTLGDGIFNADSDSWKTQRKLAHKLITQQKFQSFMVQTSCGKVESGLITVLERASNKNLVLDLQDVFKRLMFDISLIQLVGSDPGTLGITFSKFLIVDGLDYSEEAFFYRHFIPSIGWKLQRLLAIGIEKRHVNGGKCIDQHISHLITARRQKMRQDETEEKGVDLLRSYMEESDDCGSKSDKFLRDTMVTFIAAGTSTISAALTWFFWLVSQNPEVESKILEEIKTKATQYSFSPQGKELKIFSIEGLKGLVYLHGAICETLRLFPSVPLNHKRPVKPDILPSGHRVDSKTRIQPMFYSVGRMQDVWGKDCLDFKPERWISADGEIKSEPSYKFVAFNSGPRACIGKDITFAQIRMIAATLLHNYHVEVLDGHSISYENSIVLHMKHGMQVRIKRRY